MIRKGTKKKYRLRRNRKSSITRRRTNKKHSLRKYTKSKKKSLKKSRSKRGGSLGDMVRDYYDDSNARGPGHYLKERIRQITGIRTGPLAEKYGPYVGLADDEKAQAIYKNHQTTIDNLRNRESFTKYGIKFEKTNLYGEVDIKGYNKDDKKVFEESLSKFVMK
jgi:hypothetical protein